MRFTIHERKNKSKGEATASTYDFLNRALKARTQKYYLASLQGFDRSFLSGGANHQPFQRPVEGTHSSGCAQIFRLDM
jgi:hypothetical protein